MRSVGKFEDVHDLINPEWEDKPHCWIQWKGTDVCMDFHCPCGNLSHIDGDFTYTIQCPVCKRVFHPNPNLELIEITEEEEIHVVGK